MALFPRCVSVALFPRCVRADSTVTPAYQLVLDLVLLDHRSTAWGQHQNFRIEPFTPSPLHLYIVKIGNFPEILMSFLRHRLKFPNVLKHREFSFYIESSGGPMVQHLIIALQSSIHPSLVHKSFTKILVTTGLPGVIVVHPKF